MHVATHPFSDFQKKKKGASKTSSKKSDFIFGFLTSFHVYNVLDQIKIAFSHQKNLFSDSHFGGCAPNFLTENVRSNNVFNREVMPGSACPLLPAILITQIAVGNPRTAILSIHSYQVIF